MGPESIAHEAERRMGYWHRGHEGERNNNAGLKIGGRTVASGELKLTRATKS